MGKYNSYKKKFFQGEFELTSFLGNVTFIDKKYFVHSHVTLVDRQYKGLGGHLFDAKISATGEFKVDLLDLNIDRNFCNIVGLNLWDIKNENN